MLVDVITTLSADVAQLLGTIDVDPIEPATPPGWDKIETVAGWVVKICGLILLLAMTAAGATIAISYRQGEQIPGGLKWVGWVCVGAIVMGAAAQLVNWIL